MIGAAVIAYRLSRVRTRFADEQPAQSPATRAENGCAP
jgi:hypothetical protein